MARFSDAELAAIRAAARGKPVAAFIRDRILASISSWEGK
jgi:hypothetical protein